MARWHDGTMARSNRPRPNVHLKIPWAQSNHLTGCAVDIRCVGIEQAIRYATLLLDISDLNHEDFDELIIERKGYTYWIHFAVRPFGNRRRTNYKR